MKMEIRIPFERLETEENEPLSPGEINGIRAFFDMFLNNAELMYRFGNVQVITDTGVVADYLNRQSTDPNQHLYVPPENRIA